MSVVGIGDSQRGRGGVAVAPVDGGSGAINVESQPEHGVRLIELDIFRQNGAFLTSNAHTKNADCSKSTAWCQKRTS